MKVFIDPEERLILAIPEDWYFTATLHDDDVSKQPYSFEPYDEEDNGAFQLSYFHDYPKKIFNIESQPKGQKNLSFIEKELDGAKTWSTNIEGGGVLLVTFFYDDSMSLKRKKLNLQKANDSVKSLLIFDEKSKKLILPVVRWDRFLMSYVSSVDLTNRAYENGSSIELVILLANQIDAILRQSLILKKQLDNKSNIIDIHLIHQKENDKPIFEKAVYKMAIDQNVIDQTVYDELISLYEIRNKVVHRYIISDLRSNDIIKLVWSYTQTSKKLGGELSALEQRQFEEKIGIYNREIRPGSELTDEMTADLMSKIRDKHGNRKLNEGISLEINKKKGG